MLYRLSFHPSLSVLGVKVVRLCFCMILRNEMVACAREIGLGLRKTIVRYMVDGIGRLDAITVLKFTRSTILLLQEGTCRGNRNRETERVSWKA